MTRTPRFLVFLAVAALVALGGMTTLTKAPQASAKVETMALPTSTLDAAMPDTCASDASQFLAGGDADKVVPGCCSTQCSVDKDCDKICGKGNCACIQQTPCCRRCVY